MTKRLYVETWGCQMNRHQSEGIVGVLLRDGYALAEGLGGADVVLFNGCMVRQKAEEKVYGRIGAVVEEKRRRPILLGVGGCLGEIRREELLRRFPAIDFVFGVSGHKRLPEVIARLMRERGQSMAVERSRELAELPFARTSPVTAMVTITEGCSNYCSYCVVPYARGEMRSRAREKILVEVEEAVASGYREILLLGQNVNSYGLDLAREGGFAELLADVARSGADRVRFTSSHPRDLSTGILETMATHRAIAPHLHVACQSGSDEILRAMRRGYTRARFVEVVRSAREIVPELNVTTDLIVGFPGETADDFAHSLELMEEARFGSIFAAKYSPRPGTASARLTDDVPEEEKTSRLHAILDRQREIALAENERFIGRDVEVLIEGVTHDGWYGRAADHRTVVLHAPSEGCAIGDLVSARVEAATAASLSAAALVPVGGRP
jgi:tRNA-2-methylthio-N6-dimethylallyladenosine synthase